MKILNIVSAKVWGGGEQYVYAVCHEMTKKNIENYVLVDQSNNFLKERLLAVTNVVTANLYKLRGIMAIADILNIIDEHRIEIINCHSGK